MQCSQSYIHLGGGRGAGKQDKTQKNKGKNKTTVKQESTVECTRLTPRSYHTHTKESDDDEQRRADQYSVVKEIKRQTTGIANHHGSKPLKKQ